MAKTLGTPGVSLVITIPSKREAGWADSFESGFFQKVVDHDHSGDKGVRIGTAGIANEAITQGKLALLAVGTLQLANTSVSSEKLQASSVTTEKIANANVTTEKLAENAVDDTKVRLRNNQYLKGRNAADSADIDIIKINASDVVELAGSFQAVPTDNSVSTIKLQNDSVTNEKLANNSVNTNELNNGSVTLPKLANTNIASTSVAYSTSSTTMAYSGISTSITKQNTNRPLLVTLQGLDNSASNSNFSLVSTGTGTALGAEVVFSFSSNPASTFSYFAIFPLSFTIPSTSSSRGITVPVSVCNYISSGLGAGSYTIYIHARCTTTNSVLDFNGFLQAIEL